MDGIYLHMAYCVSDSENWDDHLDPISFPVKDEQDQFNVLEEA